MIRFGSMSIVLLLGALYGGLFVVLLCAARHNRTANRFLAGLLAVIALQLFPYIIGYAGFYDAFPWLSYAPYEASLAIGPLLYFYVRSLAQPLLPPRWGWHFAPVLVQVAYYGVIFPMSLDFKNQWNATIHVPYLVPLEQLGTVASLAVYWLLSVRHYRAYQDWLVHSVSDREDHHFDWIRNFLIALGCTLVLWTGFAALQRWVVKLNYFEEFPLYLWLALLCYYLGTEGYRHAGHRYPVWAPPSAPAEAPAPRLPRESRDWTARGEAWRQQVLAQGCWRDPALSLQTLARQLGTNTSDLSRAFNEGLGQNFNELINRMRVDAVKQALDADVAGRSMLDIAFEAGFSSKASFNRSFRLYTGETPTAYAAGLIASAPAQIIKTQASP